MTAAPCAQAGGLSLCLSPSGLESSRRLLLCPPALAAGATGTQGPGSRKKASPRGHGALRCPGAAPRPSGLTFMLRWAARAGWAHACARAHATCCQPGRAFLTLAPEILAAARSASYPAGGAGGPAPASAGGGCRGGIEAQGPTPRAPPQPCCPPGRSSPPSRSYVGRVSAGARSNGRSRGRTARRGAQ